MPLETYSVLTREQNKGTKSGDDVASVVWADQHDCLVRLQLEHAGVHAVLLGAADQLCSCAALAVGAGVPHNAAPASAPGLGWPHQCPHGEVLQQLLHLSRSLLWKPNTKVTAEDNEIFM